MTSGSLADAVPPIASDQSKPPAVRRRLIARALLGPADMAVDPRRKLFTFEQEMVEQFARYRLSSSHVIAVVILMMGAAVGVLGDRLSALCWVIATLAAHGLALSASGRFASGGGGGLYFWKRTFVLRDLVYGLSWAMFPLLIQPGEHLEAAAAVEVIRLAAVIVVISVGAILASPIPAAAVAGTLPTALCMAAVHVLDPSFLSVTIAVCALGAEILFLHLTRHLHDQLARSVAYRAEKDAILAELEQAKAVSDEARRRAEAANDAKSRFLATMSHELRTPLNAILGFSDIMRTEMLGPLGNSAYLGYLNDIHASGGHLLKIINEILDLSRIEAGKRELREELTSLVDIVAEARSLLDLKARQKNITIHEFYEENLAQVVADEQAIRQVVLNLVSNALKFTPAGGEVTIKVGRTQSGGQYISVVDNGPGIPEEEIPIVLSAFGQGSVSIKNAEQGTGLGIPIVQALIDLHGGNFTLRSQVGIGTEAIATLPAKRVVSAFVKDYRGRTIVPPRTPVLLKKSA